MELCYFCVGSCLEKVTRLCYHVDRNRCLERGAMMTREKWYQNDYRRYLCDMHIADWDESFLSQFSAEEYFQNLKKAHVSSTVLYYQSHAGLCYFPTKVAKMHRAFEGKEDEMRRLTDLCRQNGISVVGYYSLIFNTWAHDHYPQWRMLMKDGHSKRDRAADGSTVDFETAGGSRYGLCCPNNREYIDFVCAQIDEMLDYFEPDGLFFDMLYWSHPCYCDSCRARWKRETGSDEIPASQDFSDPAWRFYCEKRNAWMGEFAQSVTNYIKERAPHLTVEHNVSAAAKERYFGTGSGVNLASEFCGGDLAGGLLEESVACKLFREITVHQPFEYMFPKCEPDLYRHTLVKTDEHLEAAVFLAAAHHGAATVIDAIDPIGTHDPRSFDSIGRVFSKLADYEPYLCGEPVADIGVVYGLESKGKGRNGNHFTNHSATVSLIKNMIEAGIAVDVIAKCRDLSNYRMIFAAGLWETEKDLCNALEEYVQKGGVLMLSGAENTAFVEKITGCKILEYSPYKIAYLAPEEAYETLFMDFNKKYPLQLSARVPLVEAREDVRVLARLAFPYTVPSESKFASIHSDPPGPVTAYPAVLECVYGKGRVIYSVAPLENEDYVVYQSIVRNFIDRYVDLDHLKIATDAPLNVETVTWRDGETLYICNALLLNPKEKAHIPAFEVRVRSEKAPKEVTLLPEEDAVSFSFDGVYLRFSTRETRIFDMYRVDF